MNDRPDPAPPALETAAPSVPPVPSLPSSPPLPLSHALTTLLDDLARQDNPAGALYVVATPIGNAADITLRSLNILAIADAVACEDTRNTGHLLNRYGLQKQLIAAHQHNEREVAQRLIERLQAGQRIALVSDAGTPAVSDPGARSYSAFFF
jgi:16S rRNA (cytidine1402-2'-O)-methyltransferase